MKFSDRDIINMYEYLKEHTMKETSKKFGSSMSTIARICNRQEYSRYKKVIDKWVGKETY